MKINKISVMALALSIALFSCGNEAATDAKATAEKVVDVLETKAVKTAINTEMSVVEWEGTMVGIYSHSGNLSLNSGEVEMSDGHLIGGNFEVNMASMTPTDDNYQAEEGSTPEKLVGHLSSADFFDVENYPTASFVINSVEENVAMGTLTVRGISNEEKVENVSVQEGTLSGTLTFDRKKYDIAFDHPAKEMVLSNDIVLNIQLKTAM